MPLLAAAAFATGCYSTHADPKKVTTSPAKQEEVHNLIRFVKNPDPAPALGINDLDGQPISLDEFKGKIVL